MVEQKYKTQNIHREVINVVNVWETLFILENISTWDCLFHILPILNHHF